MRKARRPVAFVCIAAIAFVAFLPGISTLASALVEPQWELLPDTSVALDPPAITPATLPCGSLLSLLPSRAPPSLALA